MASRPLEYDQCSRLRAGTARSSSGRKRSTRPPFSERANALIARSISAELPALMGTSSIASGAMAWITANCPIPKPSLGSRITATRVTFGATSLNNSSHLPLTLYSNWVNPVALPPGWDMLATKTAANRIDNICEHDRNVTCCWLEQRSNRTAFRQNDVRAKGNQFCCVFSYAIQIAPCPAVVYSHVHAF